MWSTYYVSDAVLGIRDQSKMNAMTTDSVVVGKVTEMHSFCAICKGEFSKLTQKTGQDVCTPVAKIRKPGD